MKVEGVFRDWEFDRFTAKHSDGYELRIANGQAFFRDYDPLLGRPKPFLAGLSWWERRKVWRELVRERKRRAIAHVEELAQ